VPRPCTTLLSLLSCLTSLPIQDRLL
jgi:hypothetical protein